MEANIGLVLTTVHAEDPDLTNDEAEILYHVHEVVYRYRGHSRQLEGYITVDEQSGQVIVGQPLADYSQGVFETTIRSADLRNESEAQSATTVVKVSAVQVDYTRNFYQSYPDYFEDILYTDNVCGLFCCVIIIRNDYFLLYQNNK